MDQKHKVLDVTMDEGFENMKIVLQHIRSSWVWDDVKKKEFTTGITNKICGFYLCSDSKRSDMILVRRYGEKTELIIDRDAEKVTMQILHSVGSGPELYAALNNGLVYGFVPGVTTDVDTIRDPNISKLVAKELAKLHCIDISSYSVMDTSRPLLFGKTEHFLNALPEELTNPEKQKQWVKFGKSFSDLRKEFESFKQLTVKHARSPCGFTHNDLLLENVIFDEDEGKVSFIDYEYAGYNYLYYDIADHFAEYAGVVDPDHRLYPNREYQREWVKVYLDEYNRLCKRSSGDGMTPDEDLDDVCNQIDLFTLWSHLLWGIWSIVQAENSTVPFDYVAFATSRLGAYFDNKDKFTAFISAQS